MKKLLIPLLLIAGACATRSGIVTDTKAVLNVGQPTSPLDLFGQARKYLEAHPDKKAFVLADANNAYNQAKIAGEQDGLTCLPTFIACINGDTFVCGDSAQVTGLLSLHEANILGTPVEEFIVPKKFHHDCAAWLTNRNAIGAVLKNILPIQ